MCSHVCVGVCVFVSSSRGCGRGLYFRSELPGRSASWDRHQGLLLRSDIRGSVVGAGLGRGVYVHVLWDISYKEGIGVGSEEKAQSYLLDLV